MVLLPRQIVTEEWQKSPKCDRVCFAETMWLWVKTGTRWFSARNVKFVNKTQKKKYPLLPWLLNLPYDEPLKTQWSSNGDPDTAFIQEYLTKKEKFLRKIWREADIFFTKRYKNCCSLMYHGIHFFVSLIEKISCTYSLSKSSRWYKWQFACEYDLCPIS